MMSSISHTDMDIPECRSLQREEYDVIEVDSSLLLACKSVYSIGFSPFIPSVFQASERITH